MLAMSGEATAMPSRLQQGAILVLAAGLVAAGVAGGQWFMENDYVVYGYSDKTEWTVAAGYTLGEFWGLVLQTLCLPAAAVALLSFQLHFYKSNAWPPWVKAGVFLVLLVVLAVCADIADDTMTDGLVDCLWSLCESVSTTSSSDAFTAFIPTVGMMYFCVLIMFALLAGGLFVRTAAEALGFVKKRRANLSDFGTVSKEESQPLIDSVAAVTGTGSARSLASGGSEVASVVGSVGSMDRERRRMRHKISKAWLMGVLCVFFPFFIFASMAVGDSWEHMTVSGVQSYASSSVTQAYGVVWNIELSPNLILKLFPDVLIYWSFVYLVIVVALVAKAWSPLRRFLVTPVHLRCRERHFNWTSGKVLLGAMFFALLLCEGLYWYIDHGWDSTDVSELTWQDRLARTMGQLANITMGLMILPVSRNGVFEKIFGVGWEAMMAYHRRMARVFLVAVLLHMVLFWAVFAQNDDFWHDWPIAIPSDYHSDNWTIPLSTLSTWVMVITMFGFSLNWVRRKYFELFYYSHHFFFVVWAVMLWHAASAWYYVAASIALWIVDRFIRFSKGLTEVTVKSLTTWGGVTKLSYTVESGGVAPWGGGQTGMLHEAGQYAFVNVPAISLLEWHPFSISSCPDDKETTHHIKDMGPTTFTGKLRMLATLGNHVQVNVDGPYGMPVQYERYRLLVIVAGGIGVTPCVSLLRHLNQLSCAGRLTDCLDEGVRLIWSTRSVEEMVMLEEELQEMAGEGGGTDGRFSVHLHLTRTPSGVDRAPRTCLAFKQGRPDLPDYLASFSRAAPLTHGVFPQATGLVYACGPSGMVEKARAAAAGAGMDFRTETFEL